ncbi:MAG: C45 family autoproteolytic acyltransferase/hydrolase, partial [Roseburia sp.]
MNYTINCRKEKKKGFFFLDIGRQDSYFDIGYAHGRCMRQEISECMRRLKRAFGNSAGTVKRMFLEETTYLKDIRQYLPKVYEEFQGICAGSGVGEGDMLLLNCLDECYLLLNQESFLGKCTSFGLRGGLNGRNVIGQNLDFLEMFDGFQTVFRMRLPRERRTVIQCGFAGQIFGMGQNTAGVAVVSTTLLNGQVNVGSGVPNTFVQKAILSCESLEQALEILQNCPVSTATAWTISDGRRVMCVETTAHDVAVAPEKEEYFHTNHALYTADIRFLEKIYGERGLVRDAEGRTWELTGERLDAIKEKMPP